MSRKEVIVLAARTVALLLTVEALIELSYLPERLRSFLHYLNYESSARTEYWRHSYLIALGFLVTRIVGLALLALWIHKCSPEVEELLLPGEREQDARLG